MINNPADNFRSAMFKAGLDYAGPIHADGKLHRFRAEGDKSRDSWFVLHSGPPCAGAFGCWKRSIKETWCEERTKDYSDADWKQVREDWQRADAERKKIEEARRVKAREVAAWILKHAKPANDDHPYLLRKGVHAREGLHVWRGNLVVPLMDTAGDVHSLQFIGADGSKRFLPGGRVAGCVFPFFSADTSGQIVIVEGLATGLSVYEATGFSTVAAMNCGNLFAVAQALHAKWEDRQITIAGDNDQFTAANPGLTKATEAAKAIGAKLAVPQFKDTTLKGTDFNDLHQQEGIESVKNQIDQAGQVRESDDECFERLAKLSPADYDRCRSAEAERLGIRTTVLDSEVARLRPRAKDSSQGNEVKLPDVEPWPDCVDGSALLNEILTTLTKFVVAPDDALTAAALFSLHSYAFDLGDISPILFITGPTKRCGKSRLLSVLARIVNKPLAASSVSAAGLYRSIELFRPTLLIDEVDAFLKQDEQLRGLINSGHTRDAAFHLGCVKVGDDIEPRRWSTWTPKVFSGIGHLADTIEDRAVIIQMVRRTKGEKVERLRHDVRFEDLRRKCARFIADNAEIIRTANPKIPPALNDRASDNWMPLLALADLAGGDWPDKARKAALALSGSDDAGALGLGAQLLSDIRQVFMEEGTDKLSSETLSTKLAEIEGRPWAEFGKARRPLSKNQLANLLHEFRISPHGVRIGNTTPKGYDIADFEDAFSRYPASNPIPECNTATKPVVIEENAVFQGATQKECCTPKNAVPTNNHAGCGGVALQKPQTEELVEADLF